MYRKDNYPQDPGSPKLSMVTMEPTHTYAFRRLILDTQKSIADNVAGRGVFEFPGLPNTVHVRR